MLFFLHVLSCEHTLLETSLKPVFALINGVMHDLCTRPDPPEPPQHSSPTLEMSSGEPESPAGPGHPDRAKPEERALASDALSGMNLGSSTSTNGNGSVTVPSAVLCKRHHSLYEGLNGCEAGGFGKVCFAGRKYGFCGQILRASYSLSIIQPVRPFDIISIIFLYDLVFFKP